MQINNKKNKGVWKTRKAQINSEILKWILMVIIFAVIVIVVIVLQRGLPETVIKLIRGAGEVI
jgi:hypothetical protein